jgi:hypothetical protein
MTTIIRHRRDFQTYLFRAISKERRDLLEQLSLEERLDAIVRACEWHTRGRYETDLPRAYNPVSYGLWWTVKRGLLDGQTYLALRALSFRQLCGVVHILLTESGEDITKYADFLTERYGKQAA